MRHFNHRLVSALALTALGLSACGVAHDLEEPSVYDPRPVDMVYRATIEPLVNTCDYGEPNEGLTVFVDIMPRSDGTVQLKHSSIYIPLSETVTGIVRDSGLVDHFAEWTSGWSEKTYLRHIHGHITPDEMDLTIDSEDERWTVTGGQKCRKKVRLTGKPLPIKDPKALFGVYKVSFDEYGNYCFYQPRPEPAKHQFNARMDIRQHYTTHKNATYKLNGRLALALPLPDQDNAVESGLDHNGKPDLSSYAYSDVLNNFQEYRASTKGTVRPPDLDLDVWLSSIGSSEPCANAFRIHGRKLIPSAQSIDGYWRMEATGWNGCKQEPVDGAWQAFLLEQADGTVDLWEDDVALDLKRDGQRVHQAVRSEIQGYDIRLEGFLDPPHFSYFMTIGFKKEGGWCWLTMHASGQPRFLP